MDFDVQGFLQEPLRPASVSTVTAQGRPALATMWFLFEDWRFWFHSPSGGQNPFLRAARAEQLVAAMVETFDPTDRVIQVRVTGPAKVHDRDGDRVHRLYDRYVGPNELWSEQWEQQAADPTYELWSIEPRSGAAVQYPRLQDAAGVFRWTDLASFQRAVTSARGSAD